MSPYDCDVPDPGRIIVAQQVFYDILRDKKIPVLQGRSRQHGLRGAQTTLFGGVLKGCIAQNPFWVLLSIREVMRL